MDNIIQGAWMGLATVSFTSNTIALVLLLRKRPFASIDILLLQVFIMSIIQAAVSLIQVVNIYILSQINRVVNRILSSVHAYTNINLTTILLVLSIQRFFAVHFPLKSLVWLTKRNTWWTVLLVYISTTILFVTGVVFLVNNTENIDSNFENSNTFNNISMAISVIAIAYSCIMIACYVSIVINISTRRKIITSNRNFQNDRKTIVLSLLITISFVASSMPNMLVGTGLTKKTLATYFSLWLDAISTPWIYIFITRKCCSKQQQTNDPTISYEQ